MKVDEIKKYVNLLLTNIYLKLDYSDLISGNKRLLIVEGVTDRQFIESILKEDVICEIANKAFGSNVPGNNMNNKRAIEQVVSGLSKFPLAFLNLPERFNSLVVYGLIDMDFDDEYEIQKTNRLFVTDTHDLETLMISSDKGVLNRLENCFVSEEESKKAFYIAYQLGLLRKTIIETVDERISLKPISGWLGEVNYASFLEGYEINVRKLISYINTNNDEPLSKAKEKKVADKLIANKLLRKKLNKDGVWDSRWESFDCSDTEVWSVMNGHDILSVLRYISQDAYDSFGDEAFNIVNRKFEFALIKAYDYSSLSCTDLYKAMHRENVIVELND